MQYFFSSDHQISRMLERQILDGFEDFGKDFVKSCSQEELAASIPVTVRKKIKTPFNFHIYQYSSWRSTISVYESYLRI